MSNGENLVYLSCLAIITGCSKPISGPDTQPSIDYAVVLFRFGGRLFCPYSRSLWCSRYKTCSRISMLLLTSRRRTNHQLWGDGGPPIINYGETADIGSMLNSIKIETTDTDGVLQNEGLNKSSSCAESLRALDVLTHIQDPAVTHLTSSLMRKIGGLYYDMTKASTFPPISNTASTMNLQPFGSPVKNFYSNYEKLQPPLWPRSVFNSNLR